MGRVSFWGVGGGLNVVLGGAAGLFVGGQGIE
jgi:hypothetical protein